jgi:hypothetical protein
MGHVLTKHGHFLFTRGLERILEVNIVAKADLLVKHDCAAVLREGTTVGLKAANHTGRPLGVGSRA